MTREFYCDRLKSSGQLSGYGYYLDDIEQWNDVKLIPDEIEEKIKSLFVDGYDMYTVEKMIPSAYKWAVNFMALYHISYFTGYF